MKLYDAPFPGTRASRVRWMLEEVGATYEHAKLDVLSGAHKTPEYLALHPHGLVPTLEWDGATLIESCGIVMQLADVHAAAGLAPPVGSRERAAYYQWIVYAASTLDDPIVGWILHTSALPEPRRRPEPVAKGKEVWAIAAPFLEKALTGRDHLLGDRFSAADVAVGYDLSLVDRLGGIGADLPALRAYVDRLRSRPAFRRAYGP